MAFLNKEAYEGKARYAEQKMRENKEVSTLTEEQHEVLADICELRHKLHTSYDELWNAESNGHDELVRFVAGNVDGEGSWLALIAEVDLPSYGYSTIDIEDLMSDIFYDNRLDWFDDDREDDKVYDEYRDNAYDQYSKEHKKIEEWLKKIDEEYGTNYAPTGASRIY